MLSKRQQQVVECSTRNCLGVAGPGSGKTRVLVHKADHILRSDPAGRILITTFTQDAASEIRKRVLHKLEESGLAATAAKRIASGTFHSIALSQLRQAGFDGTIISTGQMFQYIERALADSKVDMSIEYAVMEIEKAKCTPGYEPGNDPVGKLFMAYDRLTKRNNVLDFSDMLARTLRMMRDEGLPTKDCKYLFVDEMQDIDEMQYAWIAEHLKAGAILTGIGDDDQSIYRFRRALGFEGMMRMHKEYDAEIIMLDTNYRSHIEIVSPALKLVEHNTNRLDKRIIADRGPGGRASAYKFESLRHESESVCEVIRSSLQPAGRDSRYSYIVERDEWAVLARNNIGLEMLVSELKSLGIPYISPVKSIWEKPPVCYALGLLMSLLPKKGSNGQAVYQSAGFDSALHFVGVGEDVLQDLHERFGGDFSQMFIPNPDFSMYPPGTQATLENFAKKNREFLKELRRNTSAGVNNAIVGVFNWFSTSLSSGTTSGKDKKSKNSVERDRRRLEYACSDMLKMDGDLQKRLSRLLRKSDDDKAEEEKLKEKPGKVFLGTLHSSKGLEFTNVWLLTMDDEVIPDPKVPSDLDEERRLFYVGMTRAKDNLFISCAKTPSIFIEQSGLTLEHILLPDSEEEGVEDEVA